MNRISVLMSEKDYESFVETTKLLSEKGFKKSIRKANKEISKGDLYTFEDIFGGN